MKPLKSIKQIEDIIDPAYRMPEQREGNNLILEETENVGKTGKLCRVKLNVRDIDTLSVYKFDQSLDIANQRQETYAPFLRVGAARYMCDFIIFFRETKEQARLHAWVVNLKSSSTGNNVQQMRAGRRLCEFLLGKFDDLLKIQDRPEDLVYGEVNYILFKTPKTEGTGSRPGTNPLARKLARGPESDGPDGRTPERCLCITAKGYDLRSLRYG